MSEISPTISRIWAVTSSPGHSLHKWVGMVAGVCVKQGQPAKYS